MSDRFTTLCAFGSPALTLRVYGRATVTHPHDAAWGALILLFPTLGGSRQIFDLAIESVETSCGTGVPIFEMTQERGPVELEPFCAAMAGDELHAFRTKKNTISLDGKNMGIFK